MASQDDRHQDLATAWTHQSNWVGSQAGNHALSRSRGEPKACSRNQPDRHNKKDKVVANSDKISSHEYQYQVF